ncbi:MAG: NHLP family bacteriocin export ABC transporter peptidase/permease/ATPase subunit [Acidobacteriota bacterium]
MRTRRVKTPTVLQMEVVECGAAALASVLGYHGRVVPLEELRVECGVSRDGSKANNMLRAARSYGMIAKGFRKEPAELRELSLPMIVFWNFNHFVVVEGWGKGLVYINDPACGPKTVSEDEFDESFTGVALTFEPGPDFTKGGVRRSLYRALASRLPGSETALAYIVLAGLMLVIPGIVIPTFTKVFVDDYLVAGMDSWIKPLLLAMGLTAVMRGVLTWLQQRFLLRLQTRMTLSSSSKFLWHVLHLPIEFFSQRFGGEIGSRVAINDRIGQLLSGDLATSVLNLVTLVFYAALMFRYDRVLTLVGILVCLLNIEGLRLVSRKRTDLNQRYLQESGKLLGTGMRGLQMIESLKACGSESDLFSRWAGYQAKAMNAQQQMGLYTLILSALPSLLSSLNTVAILGIGGLRIMDGHLSMGMLVAFQSLMSSFTDPVNKLVNLGGTLQEAEGDMNRLEDVLRCDVEKSITGAESASGSSQAAGTLAGSLELRNVTFGYSRLDPPLIADFSLVLKPGDRVALVGATGSGKSTISRLASGLYQPWQGTVLLDGMPRDQIPRDLITNSVAMVDQDIFMFEGSVRDNLTLWDTTVSEADLIRAAKDASIHEDIAARQGGYDCRVAEAGRNFSGGQRQRMEIARALVGNPSVLVLDEATSALDTRTEATIDDNLRRRGCTCLIVAHRLSTIRDCDEIIVLDRGTVVQRGTHDELVKVEGPYAELIGQ